MIFDRKRWVVMTGFVVSSILGLGTARAANLLATETTADVAFFVADSNWDVTPFTFTSLGESASGSGAFLANATATGSALLVLTEPGGGNSDWLLLTYSGAGGVGVESMTALWQSDSEAGGLPTLPPGVTPSFLAETGGVQDATALLIASATASGFAFPSNITLQVQSDLEAVPEPASLSLLSAGVIAFGGLALARKRKRTNPRA
jgi:hypothetical protein